MATIKPFLWYDNNAVEARNFYCNVFKDSETTFTMGDPAKPLGVTVRLNDLEVTLFNGGPRNKLSEALSLFVTCENQEEVDYYWDALQAGGGSPSMCGWLLDKFGVSWQVCPSMMMNVLAGEGNPEGNERAFQAMMGMSKLEIAGLKAAYDGTA